LRKTDKSLDETRRLMGTLARMKPKPHDQMKVGNKKAAEKATRKTTKTGN
jgi:hypothetical protein